MNEMKEERAFRISMLIDGELSKQESSALIDEIQRDKALREVWVRYQAASSLMRSEINDIAPGHFSDRVRQSLQAEPTVLAPQRGPKIHFDRAAVGAIAASVLVFAVMVGNSPDMPAPSSLAEPLNIASNAPSLPVSGEVVTTTTGSAIQVAESSGVEEEVWIQDERLNDYLMKHSEKTHSAGAFGVLPFARVVSYGSGH